MWCIAPLSDEKRVSESVLPMVRRLDLRGGQCTAPVSGWCLDVKWMFGIEGWNEGFDLLRISLGMEFPCLNAPLHS